MSVNYTEQYIFVKGYIDAKDERQRTIYGTFMAVVSRRDTLYLGVMFGIDEIAKETDFDELYAKLQSRDSMTDDVTFSHNEAELQKFLDVSRTLNTLARNRNAKQAEQAISRFCTENLHLKAVTFIFLADAAESQLGRFAQEKKESAEHSQTEELSVSEDETAEPEKNEPRKFILRCEPVLDPVKGVAMSNLSVGNYICAKLPSDSVFYKLLARNLQDFDGVINAMVSGIFVNELGTAVVSLQLADDVAGVMKMSAKVKVKTAPDPKLGGGIRRKGFSLQTVPAEVVFGVAVAIIVLCSVGLIFYLMT